MKTTVVGNYPKIPNRPRPARLRNAINRRDRGEISDEELERVYDEVTVEVIEEQVAAGVDIITDGQVRWDDDQTYVMRRIRGVEIGGLQRYLDTNTYYRQPEIAGELRWEKPVLARDWQFAQEHSARPVKAVVPGPYTLAVLSRDRHYGNREKLANALAEQLRFEVEGLAAAGCRHIQVNDPVIVFNKDDIDIFVQANRRLLDNIEPETGIYTWSGDANTLLHRLVELPVDVIGLDFVWGPQNWTALRGADFSGKKLGLGVVDGRNTRLETAEQVAEAVRRAGEAVPPERLYLNPSSGLEYLPREVAFEKLRVMVEGARQAAGVAA